MLKKAFLCFLFLLLILGIVFAMGPRIPIDSTLHPLQLPAQVHRLDDYLKRSEARFTDIRPQTEKTIVWADPQHKKQTQLSIMYLHGFSATRQETDPLTTRLARRLGANVYYTRLRGHGRTGEALANASINDWINDTFEALQISKKLGKKVLVLASSTGATLATWLATQVNSPEVIGHVYMSPNFAPKDKRARFLLLPWGAALARALVGTHREWKPFNKENKMYWTCRYPVRALLPMMGLVNWVDSFNLRDFKTPVFILYSPRDVVIDVQKIQRLFPQLNTRTKKLLAFTQSRDPGQHILAGRVLSPQTTPIVLNHILQFVRPLLSKSSLPVQRTP